MARPNFFNDNVHRTFPFIYMTAGVRTPAAGAFTLLQLPDNFIADCGFIMGPESGFVEGQHKVFLQQISRVSEDVVSFELRCDAPNLAEIPLVFYLNVADGDFKTIFVESDLPVEVISSQSLSLSVSQSIAECGEPFWSGYLTTGIVSAIFERLAVGEIVTRASDDEVIVEPALIQNLNECQLVSLNIANSDRTRAMRPDGCPPYDWVFKVDEVYTNYVCLQGDVRLRPGYNMSLAQDNTTNTIQFSPVLNAGLGQPCEEVKLFAEEIPPVGSENGLLEGDFYCNEVFRSINGLQGPNLVFFAGTGISITASQETSTILVDINLVDLSVCTYSAVSESI